MDDDTTPPAVGTWAAPRAVPNPERAFLSPDEIASVDFWKDSTLAAPASEEQHATDLSRLSIVTTAWRIDQ